MITAISSGRMNLRYTAPSDKQEKYQKFNALQTSYAADSVKFGSAEEKTYASPEEELKALKQELNEEKAALKKLQKESRLLYKAGDKEKGKIFSLEKQLYNIKEKKFSSTGKLNVTKNLNERKKLISKIENIEAELYETEIKYRDAIKKTKETNAEAYFVLMSICASHKRIRILEKNYKEALEKYAKPKRFIFF